MDGPKTIALKNLSTTIDGKIIFQNLNLELKKEEILSITGPSGSGKTTLLRIIAGFHPPSSGSGSINGTTISPGITTENIRKRRCSMVFQDLALWPHLDAENHLRFMLPGKRPDGEQQERINHLLEGVGLGDKKQSKPSQLSGGEQQRLAFARALITTPELLLLDEPFTNLDFSLKQEMISLLLDLKENYRFSVIFVAHGVDEIVQIADSVMVLDQGLSVFYGSCEAFAEQYRHLLESSIAHIQKRLR